MHVSMQPTGALFFQPKVSIESDRLREFSVQSRARAGRTGLGEVDVAGIIGSVAQGAGSIIGSIFGSQTAASNAQATQAAAQAQMVAAQAQAQAQAETASTNRTMYLVAGGIALAGIAAYVFTR